MGVVGGAYFLVRVSQSLPKFETPEAKFSPLYVHYSIERIYVHKKTTKRNKMEHRSNQPMSSKVERGSLENETEEILEKRRVESIGDVGGRLRSSTDGGPNMRESELLQEV